MVAVRPDADMNAQEQASVMQTDALSALFRVGSFIAGVLAGKSASRS